MSSAGGSLWESLQLALELSQRRRRRAARAARPDRAARPACRSRAEPRPTLRQRRVTLVQERADVAEQSERRTGKVGVRPRRPGLAVLRCRASADAARARRRRPAGTRASSRARSGTSRTRLATDSSCAERWRCCHNGVRRPGRDAAAAGRERRTRESARRTAPSRRLPR